MSIIFPIVKPVLPDISRYQKYIHSSFERCWLTNSGPLLQELEERLAEYLGVPHLMLVANGTLALQVAYKTLGIEGNVATSPFSFAATASSLVWHDHKPFFVDIDKSSLNVSVSSLSECIKKEQNKISAYIGVHVFGNASEVDEIENVARKSNIKVVYDAAHAFSVDYKGKSLLNYGDASTLSLHATKVFHCVEGGAISFKNKEDIGIARQLINFGFDKNGSPCGVGINAKMSEVHAAMGLSLFDKIDEIIEHRVSCVHRYQSQLKGLLEFQEWSVHCSRNGAYMPVLFQSESILLSCMARLLTYGVQTRRYFYPSLSEVKAYKGVGETPVSYMQSRRILCLPLYFDLSLKDVDTICSLIKKCLHELN